MQGGIDISKTDSRVTERPISKCDAPCFCSYFRMSCTTFGRSAMLELYRSCEVPFESGVHNLTYGSRARSVEAGRNSTRPTHRQLVVVGKVLATRPQRVHEREELVDRGGLRKDLGFRGLRVC